MRRFEALPRLFTTGYWSGEGVVAGDLYRPLTLASLNVTFALWGESPVAFRILNFLGHAAVAVLVAWVALQACRSLPAALLAGALFAAHPVHADTVSGVIHRGEILATAFSVGALALHARSWGGIGEPAPGARAAAGALYLLALGAKESAVALPIAAAVLDRAFGSKALRWTFGAVASRYAAFAIVLAAYLAIRVAILGRLGVGTEGAYFSRVGWPVVVATMAKFSLLHYARPLGLGFPLVADFSPRSFPDAAGGDPLAWVGIAGIGVATVVTGFLALARRHGGAAGVLAAGIFFLPVSNLGIRIGVIGAHRLLYLPTVGLALAAAALVAPHLSAAGRRRSVLLGAGGLLLAAGAALSVRRDDVGRDALTFYRDLRSKVPGNLLAAYNLGVVLRERGDLAGAEAALRDAASIEPAYFPARHNLVGILVETGRFEEAGRELDAAEPVTDRERASVHAARATLLGRRGDPRDLGRVLLEADAALGLDPGAAGPLFTKAAALAALGRRAEATALLRGIVARPASTAEAVRRRAEALRLIERLEPRTP